MKRIILVRHGETEWNAARRLQGQTDIALNERGRAQAAALAPMIADLAPDVALTSDLSRAAETARLMGIAADHDPRLREQNLGAWEGMAIEDVKRAGAQDYLDWRAGLFSPEGGDVWAEFRARIGLVMEEALDRARHTALLVCHGGVTRAALDAALGIPPSMFVPVGPGSLSVIAWQRTGAWQKTGARLEMFNLRPGPLEFRAAE